MSRTVVYVKNKLNSPGAYYRMMQYLSDLPTEDIKIFSYFPPSLTKMYTNIPTKKRMKRKFMQAFFYLLGIARVTYFILYDMIFYRSETIIVLRAMFPRKMPFWGSTLLTKYFKRRNVYWDFDDNIFVSKEIGLKEVEILGESTSKISVTSAFLRSTLDKKYHEKVILMPTTDIAFMNSNIRNLIEERKNTYGNEIRITWLGTKSNLQFVTPILPSLDKAAKYCKEILNKELYLVVICNESLEYKTDYLRIINVQWTRDKAIEILEQSHIGIMPLQDNEFTKGKGGFKAVQYISAGIPAIVSNVGFNSSVVQSDYNGYLIDNLKEWEQYVIELAKNKEKWVEMSYSAREKWEKDFNAKKCFDYWEQIIVE